jgi:hypothetical protein
MASSEKLAVNIFPPLFLLLGKETKKLRLPKNL